MANLYADMTLNSFSMFSTILMYFLLAIVLMCNKEIMNKLKIMWLKRKHCAIELIGDDRKSSLIIATKKGNGVVEFSDKIFFINPLKSVSRNGMVVYTFVMNNTFGHEYVNDPKGLLLKIVKDCKNETELKDKKTKELMKIPDLSSMFHNVFDEPYQVDSTMMKNTLLSAQLSNQEWDSLLKFFKSKNMITFGVIALIGIGICILLSWGAYDKLVNMKLCNLPTTLKV